MFATVNTKQTKEPRSFIYEQVQEKPAGFSADHMFSLQVNPLGGILLDLGFVLHGAIVVIRPSARFDVAADGRARSVTRRTHLTEGEDTGEIKAEALL